MNGLESFGPLANLTAVGALIGLVVWMVTRGFPAILQRSDELHAGARQEFLTALDRQSDQRSEAAASGHRVAAQMQADLSNMAAELRRANDLRIQEFRYPTKGQNP